MPRKLRKNRNIPIRTCLVTGQKAEQSAFFRFTVRDGMLVFDDQKKYSGRGGYVIKDEKALEKLSHLEKKLTHFLRTTVKIDQKAIEEQKQLLSTKTSR